MDNIILRANQPPSNGFGNGKEYQSKVWKINTLNQQEKAEQ